MVRPSMRARVAAEPEQRFVAAKKAADEAAQEACIRSGFDRVRQARAKQRAQAAAGVARHLRKQVMLEVVVLVEQKNDTTGCSAPIGTPAADRAPRCQRVLRHRAHRRDIADHHARDQPDLEQHANRHDGEHRRPRSRSSRHTRSRCAGGRPALRAATRPRESTACRPACRSSGGPSAAPIAGAASDV